MFIFSQIDTFPNISQKQIHFQWNKCNAMSNATNEEMWFNLPKSQAFLQQSWLSSADSLKQIFPNKYFNNLIPKNSDKYNLFHISSNMNNYTSFHITITSDNLSRSISNRVSFILIDTLSKIILLMPKKRSFSFQTHSPRIIKLWHPILIKSLKS